MKAIVGIGAALTGIVLMVSALLLTHEENMQISYDTFKIIQAMEAFSGMLLAFFGAYAITTWDDNHKNDRDK